MWIAKRMTEKSAIKILGWKYDKPYDFYNQVLSGEAILELTSKNYILIEKDGKIAGFYCTGKDAQVPVGHEYRAYDGDYLDLGLGMRPDLTGKGLGKAFMEFIIEEIRHEYAGNLRLTVADFNIRAIRLYENLGFLKVQDFSRGSTKFNVMVKDE
ncbi:GNAT family N-acetyltransferase [Ornithinibacillus scapharcae]|uniref:GNAT family N-acetyltransferase n=1 Tax=Ornithinibacillus scapharcae TaxID=1147159 RepID=UPI000225B025|nr:GNAT family N-acetyltransferase [Ornithinibacillus scapharcae]